VIGPEIVALLDEQEGHRVDGIDHAIELGGDEVLVADPPASGRPTPIALRRPLATETCAR
jgi:hypothetical protein